MKRDMDLIREILLRTENEEEYPEAEKGVIVHHLDLCIEAGLLKGELLPGIDSTPRGAAVERLTWAGYEFLDAARTESVWKAVKAGVSKAGVSIGLPLLLEALKFEAKKHLGPLLP